MKFRITECERRGKGGLGSACTRLGVNCMYIGTELV